MLLTECTHRHLPNIPITDNNLLLRSGYRKILEYGRIKSTPTMRNVNTLEYTKAYWTSSDKVKL